MRKRRRCSAAANRRGLVDEFVVLEGRHHEEGKVHAARDVTRKDGVAYLPAPHWQALALAFLEVAPAHDGPRVSLSNSRARRPGHRVHDARERASRPTTFTSSLIFHEYTSLPSRVMCHPHEKTRRAPGRA